MTYASKEFLQGYGPGPFLGIEGLRKLIEEYALSIDNKQVSKDDHKEIAEEMNNWIIKIIPYCTQISDIISTVKTQVVKTDSPAVIEFSLKELIERINLFLRNELVSRNCELNIKLNTATKAIANCTVPIIFVV